MKILITLLFLTFSAHATDFPKEGNYVRFAAFHNGESYEYKRALISQDLENNTFVHIYTILKNDEVIIEMISELPYSWFYNESKIKSVLKNCHKREGALGEEIIENQKIATCTFYNEESLLDYSIGMVPFGQIRFQFYLGKGEFLDFHLVNFSF